MPNLNDKNLMNSNELNDSNVTDNNFQNVNNVNNVNNVKQNKEESSILKFLPQIELFVRQIVEEEKVKFKQELAAAINTKADSLMEFDSTTAIVMKAVANAMLDSFSSYGENVLPYLNKNSSDENYMSDEELGGIVWNSIVEVLEKKGYFEKNANVDQEIIKKDLEKTLKLVGEGMEKFAEDNFIDFHDKMYIDVLKQLIEDGTFLNNLND